MRVMSAPVAALGALAVGLTHQSLELAGMIKADLPFAALLAVIVALAVADSDSDLPGKMIRAQQCWGFWRRARCWCERLVLRSYSAWCCIF